MTECIVIACRLSFCPEHLRHDGEDHTYQQHHAPEDHVGPDPCRCPIYSEICGNCGVETSLCCHYHPDGNYLCANCTCQLCLEED